MIVLRFLVWIGIISIQFYMRDSSVINVTSVLEKHSTVDDLYDEGVVDLTMQVAEASLKEQNIQTLLRDQTQQFDVVIADLFENEVLSGLSVLYNCPLIWNYSMGIQWSAMQVVDEATNPAYTTHYFSSSVPPLTLVERVQELWTQIRGNFIKEFITRPKEETLYNEVFEPLLQLRGRTLPAYREIIHNASFIFANEHNAIGNIPSTPQNFKLTGGLHIDNPVKPLSQDLQQIMDHSEHGVIYFSLGSVWKSKDMPLSMKRALIKMFGDLKQTVIWKYEGKDLRNLPKNLVILDWAPQTSILNHPKCSVFITHSGMLSSVETVYFGVPIIGVPLFFDQLINAKKAELNGYSITVPFSFNLANDLKQAIIKMLSDQRYSTKVKQLTRTYHDRPVPLHMEVIHWVEHVIRTRGAVHLRSPALQLHWYQKMYIDLIALVIALVLVFTIITRKALSLNYRKNRTSIE